MRGRSSWPLASMYPPLAAVPDVKGSLATDPPPKALRTAPATFALVGAGPRRGSWTVTRPMTGATKGKVGGAVLKAFGVGSVAKLPFTSGTAANGGYIDANGQLDLPRIHFAA